MFLLGVLLRVSMTFNYDPDWAYDAVHHWEVVTWIKEHGRIPAAEAMVEAYHPPLFYATAAGLVKLGVQRPHMVWLSVGLGVLRLALIWAGLELCLRRSRLARVVALTLAAVVSASVHIDGMIYPEAMSCFLLALAMVLFVPAFRRHGAARWPWAVGVGVALGLALLTKISGLAVVGALGVAVGLEWLLLRRPWARRTADILPWVASLAVILCLCGWYYQENMREYDRPFVSSFDLPTQKMMVVESDKKPYLERRTLAYFLGWNSLMYEYPFFPTGLIDFPRFFPVVVTSTFLDYWGYGYTGYQKAWSRKPARALRSFVELIPLSRATAGAGTAIFVATALAWLAALVKQLRDRDIGRLALVLVPLFTFLSAAHFATAFPVDGFGVAKGVYMTFGAPPLYGLFGVAVAWSVERPVRWPLAVVLFAALGCVAAYSLCCRLGIPAGPVS